MPVHLKTSLQKYLKYVCTECQNLKLSGITKTANTDAVSLDEVYVSLTAEREITITTTLPSENKRKNPTPSSASPKPSSARNSKETQEKAAPLVYRTETRFETVLLPAMFRNHRHLVVLGDPGAGKTTLVRFLARQFALASLGSHPRVEVGIPSLPTEDAPEPTISHIEDYGETCLPILIRVADYAKKLSSESDLPLHEFLYHARGGSGLSREQATALFEYALNQGRAFILLDGLDEVISPAERNRVVKRIDEFASGIGATNRLFVTSRIAGYIEVRLDARHPLLTMRDMGIEQIERFVVRRMMAYERTQTEGRTEAQYYAQAHRSIKSILEAVHNNEGVSRLAVNPLLLTILCMIHRTNVRLPDRRVELYSTASEILLDTWRRAQTDRDDCTISMDEADRYLAPLAEEMHETEETGLISKDAALIRLHELCATWKKLPITHPEVKAEVKSFWTRLIDESSVFVARAPEQYAFLHLTFEEYWAARSLIDDDDQKAIRLRERRHQPRFEEVILLAIASHKGKNASALIRKAIWCPDEEKETYKYLPSKYENILHRDLFLAAKCLRDCTGVEPSLSRAVAKALVPLCLKNSQFSGIAPLGEAAGVALGTLQLTEAGAIASSALLTALKDENSDIRSAAAYALGNVAGSNPEVVTALLDALKGNNELVRDAAAYALGNVAGSNPEGVTALLDALEYEWYSVRSAAAYALGNVAGSNPEVVTALLKIVENDEVYMRSAAAYALGNVAPSNLEVVTALLDALKDDDEDIRSAAANGLGNVAGSNPEVVAALLDALKDDDLRVRDAAARALGNVAPSNLEVVTALLDALKDDDEDIRSAAANGLGNVAGSNPEVVAALLDALKDDDLRVRGAATLGLGNVAGSNPEVVTALLDALKEEHLYVRRSAVSALGNIAPSNLEVVAALLDTLEDQDTGVRSLVVGALGNVVGSNPEVVTILEDAIKDQSEWVRSAAWSSLHRVVVGKE